MKQDLQINFSRVENILLIMTAIITASRLDGQKCLRPHVGKSQELEQHQCERLEKNR